MDENRIMKILSVNIRVHPWLNYLQNHFSSCDTSRTAPLAAEVVIAA